MNFISKQARADKRLLEDSCSEAASLLGAARETAPPQLRERIGRIETYLNRLEIPNNNHGRIELSRRQIAREALPMMTLRRDHEVMVFGDSSVYMGGEQQSNHSDWLKTYEVAVDPDVLVRNAIAEIRQKTFSAGRIVSDPSRKASGELTVDAMAVMPKTTVDVPTRNWGPIAYELRMNPGVTVFKHAFLPGRDPLELILLHELAHVQQIIDEPAMATFDSDHSLRHRYTIAEIDAYRFVYDVMRRAYQSSVSRWAGNESLKTLPAAKDGLLMDELTEGLPFDEIPNLVLDDVAKIF